MKRTIFCFSLAWTLSLTALIPAFAGETKAHSPGLLVTITKRQNAAEYLANIVSRFGKVERREREDIYLVKLRPGSDVGHIAALVRSKADIEAVETVRDSDGVPGSVLALEAFRNSVVRHNKGLEADGDGPKPPRGEREKGKGTDFLDAYLHWKKQRAYPFDAIDTAAYARAIGHVKTMLRGKLQQAAAKSAAAVSTPTWEYVGPKNLDVPYEIYYGQRPITGRINDVAFDPSDSNTVYVGSAGGGVWKTIDGGTNWLPLSEDWDTLQISSIAVDPVNPQIVYAGTGDFNGFFGQYSDGIHKSTDGGSTWSVLNTGISGLAVSTILIDPDNHNHILAGVASGPYSGGLIGTLYQSNDGGTTWSTHAFGTPITKITASVKPSSGPRHFYLTFEHNNTTVDQIVRSDDNGATWSDLNTGTPANANGTVAACSPTDANTVYLLKPGGNVILKSTDAGAHWSNITAGFPDWGGYDWSQYYYDYHLTVSTDGTNDVVYVGLIDIAQSPDGGATWRSIGNTPASNAITHNDQHCMAIDPNNPNHAFFGGDGGIFSLSYNPGGGTWTVTPLNKTLYTTQFYFGDFHPTNKDVMIGGTQDNASPYSNGDLLNWINPGAGDGGFCAINTQNPLIQYNTFQGAGFIYTLDGWQTSFEADPPSDDNYQFINPLTIDPSNPRYVYLPGTNKLHRWDSNTLQWTTLTGFWSGGTAVAVAPTDSNVIYIGDHNSLAKSSDFGAHWNSIDNGSVFPPRTSTCVSPSPLNKNDLLVTFSGTGSFHVYHSTDTTQTINTVWTAVDGTAPNNLPDVPTNWIDRDPGDPAHTWYVANDLGVFMTTDAGANWTIISRPYGMPVVPVNRVQANGTTGYLNAATFGRGMWRIQLPGHSTTVLAGSPNPSSYGSQVTFTATVSSLSSTPAGSVDFKEGNNLLGTVQVDGNGQAALSISTLTAGNHTINATYTSSNGLFGSNGSTVQLVQDGTNLGLTSSANPSGFHQNVTFTATATASDAGAGTPTGTVTFKDGSTTIGTANLDSNGVAKLVNNTLSLGVHTINASLVGGTGWLNSSATPISQSIQEGTRTTLSSSPNPAAFGQTVTFTSIVTAVDSSAGIPTGSVTFTDGGSPLATVNLDGTGKATYATSTLSVGSHSIGATYNPSGTWVGSGATPLNQQITQGTSSVFTSSLNPSGYSQNVQFKVTVSSTNGAAGTPTGSITFKDGSTTLATVNLDGSGVAAYSTATLSVGTHTISETYTPTGGWQASTAPNISQLVTETTTTTLGSSLNPSNYTQSVTFTATVAATHQAAGAPVGSVAFTDGASTLATVAVNGSGVATYTTTALTAGTHSISASFTGTGGWQNSTSNTVSQKVIEATTTALASSPNPSNFGQSYTLTATVSSVVAAAGTPTGSVNFYRNGSLLANVPLSGNAATYTVTGNSPVGSYNMTAHFTGTNGWQDSDSPTVVQRVQSPTYVSLSLSAFTIDYSQSLTITAKVSPSNSGAGAPTGSVSFLDGSGSIATVPVDGSGTAAYQTNSLTPGSHSIGAMFTGTGGYLNSSAPRLTCTVKNTTTTFLTSSLNPSNLGQFVTFTASVTATVGTTIPSGTVKFMEGSTLLAAVNLDDAGNAVFKTAGLAGGTHVLSAVFATTNVWTGSTGSLTQTVNGAGLAPPSNLTATGGPDDSEITLNWSPSFSPGNSVTYQIFSSASQTGPFSSVGTVSSTRFVHGLPGSGIGQYYYVIAKDSAGRTSGKSAIVYARSY